VATISPKFLRQEPACLYDASRAAASVLCTTLSGVRLREVQKVLNKALGKYSSRLRPLDPRSTELHTRDHALIATATSAATADYQHPDLHQVKRMKSKLRSRRQRHCTLGAGCPCRGLRPRFEAVFVCVMPAHRHPRTLGNVILPADRARKELLRIRCWGMDSAAASDAGGTRDLLAFPLHCGPLIASEVDKVSFIRRGIRDVSEVHYCCHATQTTVPPRRRRRCRGANDSQDGRQPRRQRRNHAAHDSQLQSYHQKCSPPPTRGRFELRAASADAMPTAPTVLRLDSWAC